MKNYYPRQKPGKPALPLMMVLAILMLTVLVVVILAATWILIRTWGGIATTWWLVVGILVWFKPLQQLSYVRIIYIFQLMLYLQQSVIFLGYLLLPAFSKYTLVSLASGNAVICIVYLFLVWLWSPRSRFSSTIDGPDR